MVKPVVTKNVYGDGRPAAVYRLDAKDQGPVFRYGNGPDSCDYLGARDVFVYEYKSTYYMHYDGAGLKGWLACLATSKDLVHWDVKGPVLDYGQAGTEDARSASYGSVYYDGIKWHMFYVGTPNVSPAPNFIPEFPYLTRKAESYSPSGPWHKRYDITPFSTIAGSYYSSAASPGQVIKTGDEYRMLFSAQSGEPSVKVLRTLSYARTRNLDSSWVPDDKPFLPVGEQVENSAVYYEPSNKTWFVFTNHLGIKNGSEYADAIWVYWTKDLDNWNPENKAIVLDSANCKWSKPNIGLPSVIKVEKKLAIIYDGNTDRPVPAGSNGNMRRDVGLAWLPLPLQVPLKAEVSNTILKTQANVMTELNFVAKNNYTDPFNQVTLDVLFTDPKGNKLRIPAFWDGDNKWKARYSSPIPGIHRFRSVCSNVNDKGLNNVTGEIEIESYKSDNPLLKHGALEVSADKRHFAYKDGAPFFWLGDTWWMGLTERLTWPEDFKELADDRRKKGFDVIQIVAGLYPDMPPFDERGKNESGFPWEKDYSKIRPEYFDAADEKIMYLVNQGFVPAIVGAWGYHLPWMGEEKMKQHWRYLIARWGALPVVWIAAGETTMPFYLSTTKDADKERQEKAWTEIIRYMRATDPFHRLVTTHPSRTARASVTDPTVLDFDMHQSGHGSPPADQAALAIEGWRDQPVMPVISGESRYEALAIPDPLPASAPREAFWAHTINSGFAGHTYGANGIWQVNGREHPYGKSPGGNNWGTTPWNEAMRLPGSTQLSAAKHLIESLPNWNKMEPMPETVSSDSVKVAPLCAGVGKQLRLIYLLAPGKITINSLIPGGSYTSSWFDPVSGEKMQNFILVANSVGKVDATSPGNDQDWVLTLVKKT